MRPFPRALPLPALHFCHALARYFTADNIADGIQNVSGKDKGTGSSIPLAEPGAAHGRYAAFAAEARTTSITATQSDMNKRAGRKVFADWPLEVRAHGAPAHAK